VTQILIMYDPDDLQGTDGDGEPFGPERRALDMIDGDRQDCLVIWRSYVGDGSDGREVVRVTATGVYEHIGPDHAQAVIQLIEDSLT